MLDRLQDEFISSVSHELRTPLTSVRAALGLVVSGALNSRPEKVSQMLELALRNTDRLVDLVNDLFDLEDMATGKAPLKRSLLSVDELMLRGTVRLESMAQKANVRFIIEAANVEVYADPDRILRALNTLMANAIHASPQNPAAMSEVRLSAHNLPHNEALIEVAGMGRGIPADKLESIFDRFRHANAADDRTADDNGLGLAICRSIVTQHGGQIWATSTLGEGATLHFTLPTRSGLPAD